MAEILALGVACWGVIRVFKGLAHLDSWFPGVRSRPKGSSEKEPRRARRLDSRDLTRLERLARVLANNCNEGVVYVYLFDPDAEPPWPEDLVVRIPTCRPYCGAYDNNGCEECFISVETRTHVWSRGPGAWHTECETIHRGLLKAEEHLTRSMTTRKKAEVLADAR